MVRLNAQLERLAARKFCVTMHMAAFEIAGTMLAIARATMRHLAERGRLRLTGGDGVRQSR
ncbi:MAG: hypothetical protein DI640_03290 [Sphingomonas taxi]|uniref:Uncharacterized protein n=1 Tax=Sphingomonas taxi TaxID=1549858 RepID=A0A2W4Z0J4_9SPHN|nr:MAG: hypothetical protein DI640_03290 [Sphingomonas taxi]